MGDAPTLELVNQPAAATKMQRPNPTQPTPGSLAFPTALLLPNKLGFYHIANPDSETAFQEDPLCFFCFFPLLMPNRFTPQEYSTAAPASMWLNQ